jgi:hypothetical protein
MNGRFKQQYYLFVLICAIFFFCGCLFQWKRAQLPQTYIRGKAPLNRYSYTKEEPVFPAERYRKLLQGELFFGKPVTVERADTSVKPVFSSCLTLLGITQGENFKDGYAVVGLKSGNEEETAIVKQGTVIAGEVILKIMKNGVVVKNPTGTGTIFLR